MTHESQSMCAMYRTSHMAAMYYTQGGQTYTWHT